MEGDLSDYIIEGIVDKTITSTDRNNLISNKHAHYCELSNVDLKNKSNEELFNFMIFQNLRSLPL